MDDPILSSTSLSAVDPCADEFFTNLSRSRSAHLIGIGGTGMKALAEFLSDAGWTISGSDETTLPESFRTRGISLTHRQDGQAIDDETELVIHSPAIQQDNPEIDSARRRALPCFSSAQVLGAISRTRETVCVAGTHGKSTTSALTAQVLQFAGWQPSALVGAESCETGTNGWFGAGTHLILESCEYQRNFLQLTPAHLAITSIEPDHFDCFPQLEGALDAYAQFAASIAPGGTLLIPAASTAVWSIVRQSPGFLQTFGVEVPADWQATDCRFDSGGTSFELKHLSRTLGRATLKVPGRHNIANALVTAALAGSLGVEAKTIIAGLESFAGIRRRFEIVAQSDSYTLIDDYAHHPTAIRETLRTARQQFPGRRLVCLFQPHQISRTESLLEEFGTALSLADLSLIPPIFTAREQPGEQAIYWAERLVERIRTAGGTAECVASLDRMASTVEDKTRAGDVILTMGAGDLNRINHELTGRLFRDPENG